MREINLLLKRSTFSQHATMGTLSVNDEFFSHTLEDVDRRLENGGSKIHGKTSIPRGSYNVIINESQRFKKRMPLLVSVPGFEGVRIHSGNTAEDTEGCILVGTADSVDHISNSRVAYNKLMNILEGAEHVRITVI